MSLDLRLSEESDLDSWFLKDLVHILKLIFSGVPLHDDSLRSGRSVETYFRNRKTQNRAGMECEFRHVLRDHSNHSGVMRSWRYFAEDHVFTFDEKLDSEYSVASQSVSYLSRYLLGLLLRRRTHPLRLPGLMVIAINLMMPHRLEESCSCAVTDCQQSDLIVKIHKALNDDLPATGTSALLGNFPSFGDLRLITYHTLAVTGRTHHRLNHARETDPSHGGPELIFRLGKLIP